MAVAHRPHGRAGEDGFVITLIASTFLMGSSFVAGKVLLEAGWTPMILVGWRFFVAALATLPLLYFDGGPVLRALFPKSATLKDGALVAVIGLLQTAAVMGLLFLAMQSISASVAAILLFTNPIWVAILGRVFLGEVLTRGRLVGLALGILGVALAIGINPQALASGGAWKGQLIGVLSAVCWASATIINKRARLPLGSWALSFSQMLIGSLAILGIAYGSGQHWPSVTTPAQWGWFAWLAIPASTGSFGLWFLALKKGGATRASGYLFLAPAFTVILSYFVFAATTTWVQAAGGALVGLALWLINREAADRSRKASMRAALTEGRP